MFDARVQAVMDEVDGLREKVKDHWQIPRVEAEVLAQLVRLGRCVSLCEIGVSYGYSTLHLAAAAKETGGHVHAIDIDGRKIAAAREHLQKAGLMEYVTLKEGDAREVLRTLKPAQLFDFVFIDAVKEQSREYLEAIWDKLARPCTIVTDNTTTHAKLLAGFVAHLRGLAGVRSCEVPVGNGFELSIRVA